jgi:hypothetical protein
MDTNDPCSRFLSIEPDGSRDFDDLDAGDRGGRDLAKGGYV